MDNDDNDSDNHNYDEDEDYEDEEEEEEGKNGDRGEEKEGALRISENINDDKDNGDKIEDPGEKQRGINMKKRQVNNTRDSKYKNRAYVKEKMENKENEEIEKCSLELKRECLTDRALSYARNSIDSAVEVRILDAHTHTHTHTHLCK